MTAAVPLVERLAKAVAEAITDAPLAWDFFPEPDAAIETVARALLPVVEQAVAEARGEALREVRAAIDDKVTLALPMGRALVEADRAAGQYARINPDALLALMDEAGAIRAALDRAVAIATTEDAP